MADLGLLTLQTDMNLNWTTIYVPLISHFFEIRPCSREKVHVLVHLRLPINVQTVKCHHTTCIVTCLTIQELALAQPDNPELSKVQEDSSLRIQSVPFLSEGISIICDTSTGVQHPYIPQHF